MVLLTLDDRGRFSVTPLACREGVNRELVAIPRIERVWDESMDAQIVDRAVHDDIMHDRPDLRFGCRAIVVGDLGATSSSSEL